VKKLPRGVREKSTRNPEGNRCSGLVCRFFHEFRVFFAPFLQEKFPRVPRKISPRSAGKRPPELAKNAKKWRLKFGIINVLAWPLTFPGGPPKNLGSRGGPLKNYRVFLNFWGCFFDPLFLIYTSFLQNSPNFGKKWKNVKNVKNANSWKFTKFLKNRS
jgi:hypothetical protein